MKSKIDFALTATLVLCAVITTIAVIHRELAPSSTPFVPPQKTVFIQHWETYVDQGAVIGTAGAPVTLIEFGDFECPYCATLHNAIRNLREHYPGQITLSYIHFPLAGHRFAMPAAKVAECAREQGRFVQMYD